MLRYVFVLLVVVISACVSTSTRTEGSRRTIFREITIEGDNTIALGKRFAQQGRAISTSTNTYQLRQGTFGGAEAITVYTHETNIVKAMRFDYGPDANFHDKVAVFAASLGDPTGREEGSSGEIVYWTDAETRFEMIVKKDSAGKREVYSTMVDLITP